MLSVFLFILCNLSAACVLCDFSPCALFGDFLTGSSSIWTSACNIVGFLFYVGIMYEFFMLVLCMNLNFSDANTVIEEVEDCNSQSHDLYEGF